MDPHADLSSAEPRRFVADILRQSGSPIKVVRGLAYRLAALRKIRDLADYEIDEEFRPGFGLRQRRTMPRDSCAG